jgi:triosephosphate isomerase
MNLVVANWKMHKTRSEVEAFVRDFASRAERIENVEIAIAPAFPFLGAAGDARGRWSVAAQDCGAERAGAFTGEVSAEMIASEGARYVILGHSERRRLFRENVETLSRKLARAREAGLIPIFCVGESEEEKSAGRTAAVLDEQIRSLDGDAPEAELVLAYEPVWAIGTGRNANPEEICGGARHIVERLSNRPLLRVLYGGSVTPDNADELIAQRAIAGFLVGGASLSPESFEKICRSAASAAA